MSKCELPSCLWLTEVLYSHISSKSDFYNLLEILTEIFLLICIAIGISPFCAQPKGSQSLHPIYLRGFEFQATWLPCGLSSLMGSRKIMILPFIYNFFISMVGIMLSTF